MRLVRPEEDRSRVAAPFDEIFIPAAADHGLQPGAQPVWALFDRNLEQPLIDPAARPDYGFVAMFTLAHIIFVRTVVAVRSEVALSAETDQLAFLLALAASIPLLADEQRAQTADAVAVVASGLLALQRMRCCSLLLVRLSNRQFVMPHGNAVGGGGRRRARTGTRSCSSRTAAVAVAHAGRVEMDDRSMDEQVSGWTPLRRWKQTGRHHATRSRRDESAAALEANTPSTQLPLDLKARDIEQPSLHLCASAERNSSLTRCVVECSAGNERLELEPMRRRSAGPAPAPPFQPLRRRLTSPRRVRRRALQLAR